MTCNKLKFGILGTGAIAKFHADAIGGIDDALLIGVADQSIDRANAFAQQYGVKAYSDFSEMLNDENIDAVCICTPSGFHLENALCALNAKKHVVLEKPMAFSAEGTEQIINACKENNRILTVISQLRFSSDIKKAKEIISSGKLGKLVFCDLYMKYWRDVEYYAQSNWRGTKKFDGGGALMNQGIHGVDLLLYLVGNANVIAAKNKTSFHNIEVEDTSISMLEFENGAVGVIEASSCAHPGFCRRIEIIGTNGSLILCENKIENLTIGGETLISQQNNENVGTSSKPLDMTCEFHKAQIQNFTNAVFGKESLFVDANEGSRAVRLIEKIYSLG